MAISRFDQKIIDIPNAYPIFDRQYEQVLDEAKSILDSYPNLILLGRQAEFIHQDIDEIFASAKQTAAECVTRFGSHAGTVNPR